MANRKIAFDFFRVDTTKYSDLRIKKLKRKTGTNGIAVFDYIMCHIYGKNGFYIDFNDSLIEDIIEYFNLSEKVIHSIVKCCCEVGLFNLEKYTTQKILTSEEIQFRYLEMCKAAKRTDPFIPEKYRVCQEESGENSEETMKLQEEYADTSCSLPQSKVKKSKVKDINNIAAVTPLATAAKKYPIEECIVACLKDQRWTDANHANTPDLVLFNKHLERQGIYLASIPQYKKHFANWRIGKGAGISVQKMVL